MKIKWKLDPAPSGRYKAHSKRAWPMAEYENGIIAGYIRCEDSYSIERAKTGKHTGLRVYVADYSQRPWDFKRVKKIYFNLEEAKLSLERVLNKYPEFVPITIKENASK